MANRMIICGGNGAGKSTLGKFLAQKLNYKFADIENYYFPKTDTNYEYASARTKEEVQDLLLSDMKQYSNFILASVKGDYGKEAVSLLTHAVLVDTPKEIRLKRIKDRSFQKFGDRILPAGDLYAQERKFFDMVERRSGRETEDWLASVRIPTIRVDGTKPVDYNFGIIMRWL